MEPFALVYQQSPYINLCEEYIEDDPELWGELYDEWYVESL